MSGDTSIIRARNTHRRSLEEITEQARVCGVGVEVAERAWANLQSGAVAGLMISGAMGTGKDTLAPLILERSGVESAVLCRTSAAIREEMDRIIRVIEASESRTEAVSEIAESFDVPVEAGQLYTGLFFEATRDPHHGIDAFERTPRMREALQYHGHEAKLHRDAYWPKKAFGALVGQMAEGRSVYSTDGRFPNEIIFARAAGVYTVRLWTSPEVRSRRIFERDGFLPSAEALAHPGEILLDGHPALDLEVDNSGEMEATIEVVVSAFGEHREAMMTGARAA